MKIEIGDTRIRYCIEIYGKYSVIAGDSGCGKTTFFQLVQDYNDNPRLVKCSSELPVIAVDKRADEDVLGKYKNHILVLDEDNRLLKKYNVATLFQQSPNYFILISRKNMNWIPLSIDNYYKLEYKNGINYNKSIFNRYQQLYFSGVKQIVTEDKESGSQFFKEYFPEIKVYSAHSKTEITDFLEKSNFDGKTLVVYDAAAFAYEANRLFEYAQGKDIEFLDWECFENFVLRYAPFHEVLTQKECDYHHESLEQKSFDALKEKISYSKASLGKCLGKESRCGSCEKITDCRYKHVTFQTDLQIGGVI